MLAAPYLEIQRLRRSGQTGHALELLKTQRPTSDEDAFEAAVLLFTAGDYRSVLNVCSGHAWRSAWAVAMSHGLIAMLAHNDAPQALVHARAALPDKAMPSAALAFCLPLLHLDGSTGEALALMDQRLEPPPRDDPFVLTAMAETAAAAQQWLRAYQLACAVTALAPTDFRALIVQSMANYEFNNFHEALGNAQRANLAGPGAPPAALPMMRNHNRLGDFYGAISAFDSMAMEAGVPAGCHVELGKAYAGLGETRRAIESFRAALAADPNLLEAVRALLKIYLDSADHAAMKAFTQQYAAQLNSDIDSVLFQGLHQLQQGHVAEAARQLRRCGEINVAQNDAYAHLPWPVPEPRLRHDYEQLDLLRRRGKLTAAGLESLRTLQPYYDQSGNPASVFAPDGAAGVALRKALCEIAYYPDPVFDGAALTGHDYPALETKYGAENIVVIDDFLTPTALADLRRFCEEATIWKVYNPGGYTAALMIKGFTPCVLLAIADELRRRMPNVIRDYPLFQAWGYKYDQRLQGINMHADFARVNVNFWITPDAACEDKTTGGMLVYNQPVPQHWTFEDYNSNPPKLKAFLKVHGTQPLRVPYRENRCVLFDSSLIHVTDEVHFKPGFENRRVNVTLLFGRARGTE